MPTVPTGGLAIVLSPVAMLALFTVVNILNYVDRGIVPGAFAPLADYIRQDIGQNDTDTYTGILQSSFIGGYSVASISFGHMVHVYPPFRLMALGLAIWTVAVVLSGLAPYIIRSGGSYWFLVAARVLSGVGEASFQCVVPPYIDDNAPPAKRGLWLSIFYMAIPVGTAIGYGYGGLVGERLSWEWAFFIEAIPMVPLIFVIWFIPYNRKRREVITEVEDALAHEVGAADSVKRKLLMDGAADASSVRRNPSYNTLASDSGAYVAPGEMPADRKRGLSDTTPLLPNMMSPSKSPGNRSPLPLDDLKDPKHPHLHVHSKSHYPHHVPPTREEVEREVYDELAATGDVEAIKDTARGHPSFWTELKAVFTNPIYMCIVLGYAAFTGVVAGISTFAPAFIVGFGLLSNTEEASLSAGAMAAVAGALGVPLGGWFIDRGQRKAKERMRIEEEARARARALGLDEDKEAAAALKPKSFLDLPIPTIFSRSPRASPSSLTTRLASSDDAGTAIAPASAPPGADADDDDGTSPLMLDMKLDVAMFQAATLVFVGTIFMIAAVFATTNGLGLFLGTLAVGVLVLMGTTAGINLAMMAAVPPESRSFAIGLGTLLLHALGDVPAPPIIGAIADRLSPNMCDANNNCVRDHAGLRDTLLAASSWLVWPILFWALGWFLTIRRQAFRRRTGFYRLFTTTSTADAPASLSQVPENVRKPSPKDAVAIPARNPSKSGGIQYEDSVMNLGISISSSLANTNYLTDTPGLEMRAPAVPYR